MFVLVEVNLTEVLMVCQTIKKHQSVCFTRKGEDCGGCLTVKNEWGLLTGDDGEA